MGTVLLRLRESGGRGRFTGHSTLARYAGVVRANQVSVVKPRLHPILDSKPGDVDEIAPVMRHQRQSVREAGGGDEEILGRTRPSPLSHFRHQFSRPFGHDAIDRKDIHVTEDLRLDPLPESPSLGMSGTPGPEFHDANGRGRLGLSPAFFEPAQERGRGNFLEGFAQRVRVQEIHDHSR